MKLTSNNPRITDVELTNNMHHFSYVLDGKYPYEADGEFDYITNKYGEYIGIRDSAALRRPECYTEAGIYSYLNDNCNDYEDGGVIEEIDFEAYFD